MIYNIDFSSILSVVGAMLVSGALIGVIVSFLSHIVRAVIRAVSNGRVDF